MAKSHEGEQPRTWLITGAAGFIGSHLVEALLGEGEQVLGLDNLSTGNIDNLEHLLEDPGFRFARADVFDEAVLDRLASEADVLVHLAAAVGVKLIVESPVHTIETNVRGTENVLQAALRYGCRVLLASTSEVYGKGARIPFREDDDVLLGPTCRSRWAYASSKMIDEFLGLAYHAEYGLPLDSLPSLQHGGAHAKLERTAWSSLALSSRRCAVRRSPFMAMVINDVSFVTLATPCGGSWRWPSMTERLAVSSISAGRRRSRSSSSRSAFGK